MEDSPELTEKQEKDSLVTTGHGLALDSRYTATDTNDNSSAANGGNTQLVDKTVAEITRHCVLPASRSDEGLFYLLSFISPSNDNPLRQSKIDVQNANR